MRTILTFLILSLFIPTGIFAQFNQPQEKIPEIIATFSLHESPEAPRPGEHTRIIVKGEVISGWHVYSVVPSKDEFAPPPTQLTIEPAPHLEILGPFYETNPITDFDPVINMELSYHEKTFFFYQNLKISDQMPPNQAVSQKITVKYQTCSDKICLPPQKAILNTSFTSGSGPVRDQYENPRYDINPLPSAITSSNELEDALREGFWGFIGLAVLSGFLALLTPCVFPMIPVTIAFFTKQEHSSYAQVVRLSSLFGIGIIGTYTVTGMGLSVLLGATGAVQLATNGTINFAIGLLFLVFAFSLMGFFQLSLGGLGNKLDQISRRTGGALGVILMGLVFTLTSFTCTVQFVGTLLIAASQGHWLWPIIGMLVFATVFALPFFLLGLIPQLIQTMQSKSGSWLSYSKIVLGLVELAAAFKFFSNADLVWQWGVIDRDFVLYAWIILAFLSSLFLLGTITIHDVRVQKTGAIGFSVAFSFLFLGAYMTQGLQGKPLNPFIDAYLPPELSISENIPASLKSAAAGKSDYDVSQVHTLPWMDDLSEALVLAKQQDKHVFVDFTGYTCVNCRWMEKNIFADPKVLAAFKESFILVQLYTDGGKNHQENQSMQVNRFNTLALPFYVVLDAENQVLMRHSGIMSSSEKFLSFLHQNRVSG
ncbi:MAG: thioredoxin family protein [SAR324 cluster bacterium]|nr:thioredoxin family protein [SAR324 cluster bacterium]